MGLKVWLACFCESLHTTHTGCLSSRQKSLSFSLCKLQISSDPDESFSSLSFRNDSHKLFNAILGGIVSLEDLLLQTGHSRVSLLLQNCWRHSLQKLWSHDRRTRDLNLSQHTRQDSSSGDTCCEAIFTVRTNVTLLSLIWFQKRTTTRITKICCLFRNKLLKKICSSKITQFSFSSLNR